MRDRLAQRGDLRVEDRFAGMVGRQLVVGQTVLVWRRRCPGLLFDGGSLGCADALGEELFVARRLDAWPYGDEHDRGC